MSGSLAHFQDSVALQYVTPCSRAVMAGVSEDASGACEVGCLPAMMAEAGLVPCADTGMMHTLRCLSPFARWYWRMVMSPAYSPLAPLLGCRETASNPVISASWCARSCRPTSALCQSASARMQVHHIAGNDSGIAADCMKQSSGLGTNRQSTLQAPLTARSHIYKTWKAPSPSRITTRQ